MRHISGESRQQATLLPETLDDYVDEDHPVRVIDAFVDTLDMKVLGFSKAEACITGRKPCHPGDLLKLYIYSYLNQTRSSRRLEKECHRNPELLWLVKRLAGFQDYRRFPQG
jgi:transposase